MAEVITTEYHTYEYIGDQTLKRDDGVLMKCTSLTGAVLTYKDDDTLYTAENMSDWEESIIIFNWEWEPDEVRKLGVLYTTEGQKTISLAERSEQDDEGNFKYVSNYVTSIGIPQTLLFTPGAVIVGARIYADEAVQMGGFALETTTNSFGVSSGAGYSVNTPFALLSGTTLIYQDDGETTTTTADLSLRSDGFVYGTGYITIQGELLTGNIDQFLKYFDYNNGGTWEEVILNIKEVTFTGQGTDTTYELEEATENYKLLDIVGNTVTIQIDGHKPVTHTYEYQVGEAALSHRGDTLIVTATTKSDPSDVTCQLYQCSADPRVVDKTDYLTNIQQLSGSWVVPFDEMSPVLRINLATNLATSGNYCRIYSTGWGTKYYFIKNRVCVGQEVWDLYLEEDVLMTFKSYFKTATGLIDRSESAYNLMIPDSTIPLEVGQNVTVREITNDVFSDNYGYNYVLTGLLVGGETE